MRSTNRLAVLALLASSTLQQQMHVDYFSPLVPMNDYVPPSDFDSDPNNFYPSEFRILDCWECFEAQGKICMDQGHNSLYHHTKSSDPGDAFCCKPGYNEGYCKNGHIYDYPGVEEGITTVCSQQSSGATTEFQDILTGDRNHQMFAFCPHISQNKCGISSENPSDSTNMNLKAGLSKQHVQSNEMRYKKANSQDPSREYDACYYEVTLDTSVLDKYNPKKLHLHISSKSEINVYVYGGKSRLEATESLVSGNQQVTVGQTFSIGVDKGFLIVAYPNENKQTEFGFNYWLEADIKPQPGQEEEKEQEDDQGDTEAETDPIQGYEVVEVETIEETQDLQIKTKPTQQQTVEENDDTLFFILCAGAGVLFIAIIILCIKCRNKGKIQQNMNAGDADLNFPQNTNENERSLQLEDLDDEQNQSNRPSLGKAAVFENDSEKLKTSNYKQVNAASVMSQRVEEGGTDGPEERGQDF